MQHVIIAATKYIFTNTTYSTSIISMFSVNAQHETPIFFNQSGVEKLLLLKHHVDINASSTYK